MKRILYSVCIGSLALVLTAWGQQTNDTQRDRGKARRTSNVRATRPANTGATMGARHYNSTAQFRQRSYATPRANSNAVVNQNARMHTYRQQNYARNQDYRARSNVAITRDSAFAVNRARNYDVNRYRTPDQFRARNSVAINRDRSYAINRTRNYDVYRRANVAINNNFHSAAFRGQRYAAFRNYHRQWHDRYWWRSHYTRIVFVNGGWYFWNAGYWFPAWGYAADAYYPYDGPIYGYNGLPPDQVVVDVQEQLQRDGYYDGPIDGVLGPMTREAIAAFQADNGLAVTSVVDEPTLATLGIA
jgi:Putative peptidoglycan binding domain